MGNMESSLFQQFQMPIVILNRQYGIIFANQAFLEESGYGKEELLEKRINEVLAYQGANLEDAKGEAFIHSKTGTQIPKWLEVNYFETDEGQRSIGLILSHLEKNGIDPLTMLPNRYLFYQHLEKAIQKAQQEGIFLALLYIDLDRFKFINDTLGHTYGDLLLKEASDRLKKCAGPSNIIARMGGDEFIYLAQNLKEEKDADLLADEIIAAFREPFHLKEIEIYITPSIGISLYPFDGDEIEALISNADSAMYRAKKSGRNKVEKANLDFSAGAFEKLMIENELRGALEKAEFLLYFQPQIGLGGTNVTGMEALIRWNHPVIGIVPPAEFIPIAEETGLIIPIGDWVLLEACLKIRKWMNFGEEGIRVSVNLSAKQFLQNNLVEKIESIIRETKILPHLLELEITESMVMYNIESATDTLYRLKNLGVRIAIDDFGKGYSSLHYLQSFPLDTLKIDRSFIFNIETSHSSKALTEAISTLGHALDMKVIAEGVETKDQLRQVEKLQCDAVQGFFYSMPLTFEEANRFLLTYEGENQLCVI